MSTPLHFHKPLRRAGPVFIAAMLTALLSAGGCPDRDRPMRRAVEVYDPVADEWSRGQKLPVRWAEAQCIEVGGLIYVVGGREPSYRTTPRLLRFDPVAGTWDELPDMPTSRSGHDVVAVGWDLFVVGGGWYSYYPGIEIFNVITERWSAGPQVPNPHRYPRAVALGGEVYVIAGGTEICEAYDPVSGTWRTLAPFADDRYGFVAETDRTLIYVIGGSEYGWTSGEVWIYDPLLDAWTSGPPMLKHGRSLDSAVVGQTIYVVGDFDRDPRRVFTLDLTTLAWAEGTPKRLGYTEVAVTSAGSLLYVIGGKGGKKE